MQSPRSCLLLSPQGNKGAVAVHFNLYHSSLCFVNGHLPAHAEELEKRNQVDPHSLQGVDKTVSIALFSSSSQDYHTIMNKMSFSKSTDFVYSILDHEYVF